MRCNMGLTLVVNLPLVPKLHLGMLLALEAVLPPRFITQRSVTKPSFDDNCVPKCNLGTRNGKQSLGTRG